MDIGGKKELEHFEETVWPNYLKNGSVEQTIQFLQ